MTTQEKLKAKIQLCLLEMEVASMIYMKGGLTKEELDRKQIQLEKDLYQFISMCEPENESEII